MTDMESRLNTPRWLRQRLGPWVDRAAKTLGQPTTQVYPRGYVATVHLPIGDLEAELRDGGFAWDPLSMYHYTPEGSSTDGSWVYRSRWLGDRQLHVVLFAQQSDRTQVYAHDEFNWRRHPVKHAREVGIRRNEGVAEVRRWLAERGLEHERNSLPQRKLGHVVDRARERIRGRISEHVGERGGRSRS
ncbi:hypothetical protein [Halobacterium zhouii]|uniref:hypothetical protein n=1 Tax=Halobacterium zhouii TaxID=2902624 RepID=UPI001E3375E5|nr:hypothetical protein [Halobacterium zhouii]